MHEWARDVIIAVWDNTGKSVMLCQCSGYACGADPLSDVTLIVYICHGPNI